MKVVWRRTLGWRHWKFARFASEQNPYLHMRVTDLLSQ
jgi:hypothetical protein